MRSFQFKMKKKIRVIRAITVDFQQMRTSLLATQKIFDNDLSKTICKYEREPFNWWEVKTRNLGRIKMSSLLLDLLNLIFQMLIKEHSNLSICKLIVESDSTANRYLKVDFQLVMRNNWKRISRVWLQYSIENEKIFRKKFLKFRRKKNFLRRRRNQNGNEFKL